MSGINVLPSPKFYKIGSEAIIFRKISLNFSREARDSAAILELQRFFGKHLAKSSGVSSARFSIQAKLVDESGATRLGFTEATSDSALNSDEGYVLSANMHGINIVARTRTGIFYAVSTILQLVERDRNVFKLPQIRVADYPSMKMRGISDDISRGQISTMPNFKKIIRFLALHKMNTYMPYIENLFAFKSYPDFSAGRDPLTAEQVGELDAYGKLYHVDVIPIFETLGHMEDVLQKPEFSKYAEFPGATCLNISSDSSFEFMKTLLSEIAPAFSSSYFNMAADESFDVGLGASKALVDSVGMAEAHAQYYLKLYRVLKSLGKKVMMYGDIILENPQILSMIPKDIVIVDWHYGAAFDYPSIQTLHDSGFTVVASPAVWNFTGPFPNFYNSYANIQTFTRDGYNAGALGVVVSTWNDNGGAELRELNYPGYAWGAECAWNPLSADPGRFENLFFHQYFETTSPSPQLAYDLLSSPNNQITWYEFWRAPFLNVRSYGAAARVASISATMPEVESVISDALKSARANKDILGIYRLAAWMDSYWADRVNCINEMRAIAADSTLTQAQRKTEISDLLNHLIGELTAIRRTYVEIYLRTNRRPMLQLIETRFGEQVAALKAGADQMLAGNANYSQLISSDFIYYPGSVPYKPGNDKVDSATFFKTISLAGIPTAAEVQLIGDTYCKLFVNGDLVGEVKARRTLTWDVEMKRVKTFDIRKYLREEKNSIVVQSANFDRNGSAGFNLLGLVGQDTISTDSSWQVVKGLIPVDSLPGADLQNAVPYNNGWTVSAPDFARKLKSWIER